MIDTAVWQNSGHEIEIPAGPATLGSTAAAHMTLVVWCKDCHQVELDPAEMAERYGAVVPVPTWGRRLVCFLAQSAQSYARDARVRESRTSQVSRPRFCCERCREPLSANYGLGRETRLPPVASPRLSCNARVPEAATRSEGTTQLAKCATGATRAL